MNDEIEAAAKRCAEDAVRLLEVHVMAALREAIRSRDIVEVLIQSEATGLALSLLAQARQKLPS
jgi:hypothetical protein